MAHSVFLQTRNRLKKQLGYPKLERSLKWEQIMLCLSGEMSPTSILIFTKRKVQKPQRVIQEGEMKYGSESIPETEERKSFASNTYLVTNIVNCFFKTRTDYLPTNNFLESPGFRKSLLQGTKKRCMKKRIGEYFDLRRAVSFNRSYVFIWWRNR